MLSRRCLPQGDMVQPPKSPTSISSGEQVTGSILPPLFEDREDLEEVDHCLVSDLLDAASLFAEVSSVSAGDPMLGSTSFSPGVALTPCCSGSFSPQNWAIFWASISWASFSSCRMSSMVSPYHSSCQHQACRWARTMTFRRPAKPKRPCHQSYKLQEPTCSPPKASPHHGRNITVTSNPECSTFTQLGWQTGHFMNSISSILPNQPCTEKSASLLSLLLPWKGIS